MRLPRTIVPTSPPLARSGRCRSWTWRCATVTWMAIWFRSSATLESGRMSDHDGLLFLARRAYTPMTEGRVIQGRYRMVSKLGQGGMGAVWRGEHIELRTPVAIKVLSP